MSINFLYSEITTHTSHNKPRIIISCTTSAQTGNLWTLPYERWPPDVWWGSHRRVPPLRRNQNTHNTHIAQHYEIASRFNERYAKRVCKLATSTCVQLAQSTCGTNAQTPHTRTKERRYEDGDRRRNTDAEADQNWRPPLRATETCIRFTTIARPPLDQHRRACVFGPRCKRAALQIARDSLASRWPTQMHAAPATAGHTESERARSPKRRANQTGIIRVRCSSDARRSRCQRVIATATLAYTTKALFARKLHANLFAVCTLNRVGNLSYMHTDGSFACTG